MSPCHVVLIKFFITLHRRLIRNHDNFLPNLISSCRIRNNGSTCFVNHCHWKFFIQNLWITFSLVVTLIRMTDSHVVGADEDMILLVDILFLVFDVDKLGLSQLINLINHITSLSQSYFLQSSNLLLL